MKKIPILFTVVLSLMCNMAISQNLIAVQNSSNPVFYEKLDSAIVHAQNGDTIYLPGGTFPISVQIDKRLHIIGVGHNPDSTSSTGLTKIQGGLNLCGNASFGSLIGINWVGEINAGENISNYLIMRCSITGLRMASSCSNWTFVENIIMAYIFNNNPNPIHCFFSNNIIASISSYNSGFNSSTFKNNIFLAQGYCYYGCSCPMSAVSSTFENNIFISTAYTCNTITNSAFNNNLFAEISPLDYCSECWGSSNILNQPQSSIFVNQTGNAFSYDHDYHLQSTCPGKNAGKDGTDIGIYGGAFPWKEGSVPPNPHIQFQDVSGGTDQNGNLNVNIKVSAQDR